MIIIALFQPNLELFHWDPSFLGNCLENIPSGSVMPSQAPPTRRNLNLDRLSQSQFNFVVEIHSSFSSRLT